MSMIDGPCAADRFAPFAAYGPTFRATVGGANGVAKEGRPNEFSIRTYPHVYNIPWYAHAREGYESMLKLVYEVFDVKRRTKCASHMQGSFRISSNSCARFRSIFICTRSWYGSPPLSQPKYSDRIPVLSTDSVPSEIFCFSCKLTGPKSPLHGFCSQSLPCPLVLGCRAHSSFGAWISSTVGIIALSRRLRTPVSVWINCWDAQSRGYRRTGQGFPGVHSVAIFENMNKTVNQRDSSDFGMIYICKIHATFCPFESGAKR